MDDASGSTPIYYIFHHHDNQSVDAVSSEPKRCSIRGCTQTITDNNRMCDACRSRHRIYASTKRARRKLEKASSSNSHQSTWVLTTGETYPQETVSDSHQLLSATRSSISASPLSATMTWDVPMDRHIFMGNSTAAHQPNHSSSTSSELANALTYPLHRVPLDAAPVSTRHKDHRPAHEENEAAQQVNPYSSSNNETLAVAGQDAPQIAFQGSPAPARFCSVKGCKAVIPGSYDFKMCPPCRERYRIYGNTKRAKWKCERETFQREMSTLRAAEDERRKSKGLGPLANNLEELRAWEFSIIDEEVSLLPVGAPSDGDAVNASASTFTNPNTTSDTGGHPPTLPHSIVLNGAYPSSMRSSIDSPHAISPYPHLVDPLPARMCTVTHCHKILPGHYRFKRCEQHRLQNRYHSKLKRTREKEEKSIGPEENMQPLVIPSDDDNAAIPRQRRSKGAGKKINNPIHNATTHHPEVFTGGAERETLFVAEYDPPASGVDASLEEKKRSRNVCATIECHNLLFPGARWRNCDACRSAIRNLKFQARVAQKATENQYWKGVAERMSAARKLEEHENTPFASGSGSGSGAPDAAVAASTLSEATLDAAADGNEGGIGDSDADADGDAETDLEAADEAQVMALVNEETPAVEPDIPQGRPLIWKLTETGRPESPPLWARGYNKFRVSLPPTPPLPVPLPTAEQLMKLDDPLAFRAFKPTTTPSAIGRILARNPQISVDAFSEILEADGAKPKEVSSTQVDVPVSKPVPTPTIPTSEPFVYKSPEKKSTPSTSTTPVSTSYKGKRKNTSRERSTASTYVSNISPSVPTNQVLAPSPSPFAAPYGYPPSYPYYPYYPPPYQMPPYPYTSHPLPAAVEGSTNPPKQHPYSSAPQATSPPNFYPYPYPPQAYAYPPAMPYMAPRYPPNAPELAHSQQPYPPYPSFPPSAAPIPYPYYPPLPTAPAPAVTPAAISSPFTTKPRVISKATPAPPNSPPVRVDVKKDGNFNHYHYGLGTTTPEKPKQRAKRRKVDPDYLAKYQSLISARTAGSGSYDATTNSMNDTITNGAVANAVSAEPAPVPVAGDDISDAATHSERAKDSPPSEETSSPQPTVRTCATKTCQRSIEAGVPGNICEKCKLKFKKRQAKTKQKFKLEPRKFLLDKESIKKAN